MPKFNPSIEEYRWLREKKGIMFAHCFTCMPRKPEEISPEQWSQLEVIIDTKSGLIIVGCGRCQMPIISAILDIKAAEAIEKLGCQRCGDE